MMNESLEHASSVFEKTTLALKEGKSKGRMSVAMAAGLSAPKNPSLFDELNPKDRGDYLVQGNPELIRGNGKPIHLSNSEHKLLNALTFFITQYLDDEDIQGYMRTLAKGKIPAQRYINRYISITSLCKFINKSSRERERKAVFNCLKRLATTYQLVQLFNKPNGRKALVSDPLIILGGKAAFYEAEGKNAFEDKIEVLFGPLFFYEVANKYAVITPKLFDVWGKEKGTTLDIFPILLSDLNAKYRQYYIAAQNAKKSAEEEFKSSKAFKGKSMEYLKKYIAKKQRDALTYETLVSTIKSKVATDYESTRQYKSKFWKDIQLCIESLKKYGIIEEAVVYKTIDKVKFIFNMSFGDDVKIE